MKTSFLFFLILFFVACSQRSEKKTEVDSYSPLTEQETHIYTTPTIYYIPQFDQASQSCALSEQKKIKDKSNTLLFSVCESVYKACLLQGTCLIKNGSEATLINVGEKINTEYRFVKVQNSSCRYGFGSSPHICLDPFFSVAADLTKYKLGDVIYIPSLKGLVLPDSTLHSGYVIVRDSGSAIKGYGRFDFFKGFMGAQDGANPLTQIGLAGRRTHVPYYVVYGVEAANFLKTRNYPKLPDLLNTNNINMLNIR
jgi:hypothetical protein